MTTKSSATQTVAAVTSTVAQQQQQQQQQPPCTPERFKEICLRPSAENSKEVLALLDYLFNADSFMDRQMTGVALIKQYLTGGANYDAFKNKLKSYDTSSTCGLVWNVSYVAYRCRTCALSPCMSICAECFKNGDHRGHDYNMFRSGAGGACDCGDEYVMNPKGFCKAHSCKRTAAAADAHPPDELVKCCELVLAHLLYGFVQAFRKIYSSLVHVTSILNELNTYIEMMNELTSLGTPLRTIIVDYIINQEYYAKKIQAESTLTPPTTVSTTKSEQQPVHQLQQHNNENNEDNNNESRRLEMSTEDDSIPIPIPSDWEEDDDDDGDDDVDILESSRIEAASSSSPQFRPHLAKSSHLHAVFTRALATHTPIQVPRIYAHSAAQICKLETSTIVDELLFWCIRFELPEPLVKFLVSLLPDQRYKMHFIRSFVAQYSYIAVLLLNSKSEHICSRVVHISVQLFSNEATALKALNECYLLPVLLSTFHHMLVTSGIERPDTNESLLIRSKLEDEVHNKHMVIDPDHPIMQDNLYWLVISDLVNLLNHKRITHELVSTNDHINIWFQMLAYFQAMNLNVRKFGEHVLQEQPTYFSSFSGELECCSSVMWSIVQHLTSSDAADVAVATALKLIKIAFECLRTWLSDIGFMTVFVLKRPNYKHLTFHLPLHRYLSCFIYNALCIQALPLTTILDAYFSGSSIENRQYLLANILAHPLQLQIGFYEIHANMWVRNGMQMKGQAMTYVQNHFCSSFSDADLFLIQTLASQLDPDLFMKFVTNVWQNQET